MLLKDYKLLKHYYDEDAEYMDPLKIVAKLLLTKHIVLYDRNKWLSDHV